MRLELTSTGNSSASGTFGKEGKDCKCEVGLQLQLPLLQQTMGMALITPDAAEPACLKLSKNRLNLLSPLGSLTSHACEFSAEKRFTRQCRWGPPLGQPLLRNNIHPFNIPPTVHHQGLPHSVIGHRFETCIAERVVPRTKHHRGPRKLGTGPISVRYSKRGLASQHYDHCRRMDRRQALEAQSRQSRILNPWAKTFWIMTGLRSMPSVSTKLDKQDLAVRGCWVYSALKRRKYWCHDGIGLEYLSRRLELVWIAAFQCSYHSFEGSSHRLFILVPFFWLILTVFSNRGLDYSKLLFERDSNLEVFKERDSERLNTCNGTSNPEWSFRVVHRSFFLSILAFKFQMLP